MRQPARDSLRSRVSSTTTLEDVTSVRSVVADGLGMEFVCLDPGRFFAHWTVLRLPSMVVQFGQTDNPVIRKTWTPEDRWVFVIPMTVITPPRWNGSSIGEGEFVICPPGTESRGFDPGGSECAFLSVDDRVAAGIVPSTVAARSSSHVVRTSLGEALALRQALERARARSEPRQSAGDMSAVHADDICQALSGWLRSALSLARPVVGVYSRSEVVRQAEDFFRRHAGERVSIAHLSSVIGVSERSLRNAFYDVYTISPKRYLTIWQLHQVRQALSAPSCVDMTVTEVATLHGFFELGRFAGDYKALFGEGPSQTLSRARTGQGREVAELPAANRSRQLVA